MAYSVTVAGPPSDSAGRGVINGAKELFRDS